MYFWTTTKEAAAGLSTLTSDITLLQLRRIPKTDGMLPFELKYRIQQFHVFTSAPYFHFQILEPEDEEQRAKAIKYFKENEKTYISFVDEPTILLYIGCTEAAYIRSSINNDYDIEQLKSAMTDVSRWYQVFGKKNRDGDKEP